MHSLRELRKQAGYSIGEMAMALGLPKATYQCYEDGSRACPDGVPGKMQSIVEKDREFLAGLPARVDARINAEFPKGGIPYGP